MSAQRNRAGNANTASLARRTGVAVPLAALYTEKHSAVGEFPDLAEFARFCTSAGLSIIQLLPVNDTGTQSSPYSALSAFALHPLYIAIRELPEFDALYARDGQFAKQYDAFVSSFPHKNRFDYDGIHNAKTALLRTLYEATDIAHHAALTEPLAAWISQNDWVISYAVYKNLKWKYQQASWKSWEKSDRTVTQEEIVARWNSSEHKREHLFYAWMQFRAHEQFLKASDDVKKCGIILKGDMPILMNEDSCDAWAHPAIFNHALRAGSPPDAENPGGQNWGFPTYNWKTLQTTGYAWWKARLASGAQYYDAYRLDHVLGFFRIWACPEYDTTAALGHAEPGGAITRAALNSAGFTDERIRWLSEPHVHTGLVEDITWNHERAHAILSTCMTRLPGEELWLFNETVRGDRDIYALDLRDFCNDDAACRIKEALAQKWRDRVLITLSDGTFARAWLHEQATAWRSLSEAERQTLCTLFEAAAHADEASWEAHASDILGALTSATDMIPCGEDLGVNIACVPRVMEANGILSLRVVRWSRVWQNEGQPYVPFAQYPSLSVTATSVHDSPTLREWWEREPDAARLFIKTHTADFVVAPAVSKLGAANTSGAANEFESDYAQSNSADSIATGNSATHASAPFTAHVARAIFTASAQTNSCWFINPLQDYLYLNEAYYLERACDERINIPGTVSDFNWTYRMPVPLAILAKDDTLIHVLQSIAKSHDGRQ
ncbi:MAG: 4-alpha-glucanotransferase [Treponema sp.]|nr:4-alpha-glucanotransferase [Treponema sp.]